ncbi:MAG TPA: hypothetical protein VG755_30665 [Nannocystaceae bacterium]|nr:hypothetical protein [Nannocystaceae bacterium]
MNDLAYANLPHETLDYDALVADYTSGLVDRLRGFGPAADGLALWVPDEDPLIGLRNLWDAAACAGLSEICVQLGPTSLAQLDAERLLAMAARFGVATIFPCKSGTMVEIVALHQAIAMPTATSERIAPVARVAAAPTRMREVLPECYRAAIECAAACVSHDVPVLDDAAHVVVEGCDGDVVLTLAVNPTTLRIAQAAFAGAADRSEAGMLEALCCAIEGLPLIEAADHGAIRLEHALRDGAAPVPGIVTPRAAGSAFDLPHALLRDALASWRTQVGALDRTSTFDAGPAEAWRAMDDAARKGAIAAVISGFTEDHALPADQFALVAIEFDVRLVLHAAPHAKLAPLVMALERSIRDALDPRLEVYLEEIRDRNKLRRLAIVENDR